MDLTAAAEELYGAPPELFVARRKELARQARDQGDRALARGIEGLRRPSRGAWLVNLLARGARDELGQLLELGPELARIHRDGTPGELRQLTLARRQAIGALVERAVALAREREHEASPATRRDVETTLEAALGSPEVARHLLAGQLVHTPQSAVAFPLELFEEHGASVEQAPPSPDPAGQAAVVDLADATRRREQRRGRQDQQRAQARRVAQCVEQVERLRHEVAELGSRGHVAGDALEQAVAAVRKQGQQAEQAARSVEQLDAQVARLEYELAQLRSRRQQAEERARAERAAVETSRVREATAREAATQVAQTLQERRAALDAVESELAKLVGQEPGPEST